MPHQRHVQQNQARLHTEGRQLFQKVPSGVSDQRIFESHQATVLVVLLGARNGIGFQGGKNTFL